MMKQLEKFNNNCKEHIKNDNLAIAKLYLTACLSLNDYLKYNDYSDLDTDLIDLIDFKQKGIIYNAGYENNLDFIKNFNKDSFLYPIFLQFNSGFKISDYNGYEVSSCMISKLTLEQIKLDLIKSLDRYGIRIFFHTNYLATTSMNSSITIYNEKKIFGNKLDKNDLLISSDIDYHKRTSISFLQKHERFSHFSKTFNKNESNYIDSPRGYTDFENNQIRILISIENEDESKGEIGESLEFFLTNGKRELIDNLFYYRSYYRSNSYNFEKLFKIELMLEEKNDNLIKALQTIPETIKEPKNNNDIFENNNDNDTNNKQRKIILYKHINKNIEDKKEDKKKESDEYVREKNKLINENTFRKFTFERNTICNYKYDPLMGKLVPDNKFA